MLDWHLQVAGGFGVLIRSPLKRSMRLGTSLRTAQTTGDSILSTGRSSTCYMVRQMPPWHITQTDAALCGSGQHRQHRRLAAKAVPVEAAAAATWPEAVPCRDVTRVVPSTMESTWQVAQATMAVGIVVDGYTIEARAHHNHLAILPGQMHMALMVVVVRLGKRRKTRTEVRLSLDNGLQLPANNRFWAIARRLVWMMDTGTLAPPLPITAPTPSGELPS